MQHKFISQSQTDFCLKCHKIFFGERLVDIMKNHGLGTHNEKMCTEISTGNTTNTQKFIWPICPIQTIIWDIFEKNSHSILPLYLSFEASAILVLNMTLIFWRFFWVVQLFCSSKFDDFRNHKDYWLKIRTHARWFFYLQKVKYIKKILWKIVIQLWNNILGLVSKKMKKIIFQFSII